MKSVRDWERKQMAATPPLELQIISLLGEYLKQIDSLRNEKSREESSLFIEWQSSVDAVLRRTFGENSAESSRFGEISYNVQSMVYVGGVDYTQDYINAYNGGLDKAKGQLSSISKLLESMGMPVTQPILKKTGTNITVNPVFTQAQGQKQVQQVKITLEKAIDNALSHVQTNHVDETIAKAEAILKPLKRKDVKWPKVQKAITFFLGLGREAFFSFAPVLYQMAMTKP